MNKMDVVDDSIADECEARLREHGWEGPVHRISAATGLGCDQLMWAIFHWLGAQDDEAEDVGDVDDEDDEHDAGADD